MTTLLNTTWTVTAANHDFLTTTVDFLPNNVAKIAFSNGYGTQGTWSQGKRNISFLLQFTYPNSGEEFDCIGSHRNGKGSGTANIEWGHGVQKSPFNMTK